MINTIKPDFFQNEIQKALKERKSKQALSQNRFIEMNEEMLHLITHSQHVSTGKYFSEFIVSSHAWQGTQPAQHSQAEG